MSSEQQKLSKSTYMLEQNQVNQKEKELKNKRIQEVRKQEFEWSKKVVNDFKETKQSQKEQDLKEQKYREYLEKLQQIEALSKQKEKTIVEIGQAQLQAQLQEEQRIKEEKQKKLKSKQDKIAAQSRFQQADDWRKQEYLRTEAGKQQSRASQYKEFSTIVKQKEKEQVSQYKEFVKTRSRIFEFLISKKALEDPKSYEQPNYEQYDKNVSRKTFLKPEDFSKSHLHNQTLVVKNDISEEQENAMDKANTCFVESQFDLEERAKTQRQFERAKKERGVKALSQEKQKKIVDDLMNETKFIKKNEIEQKIKTQQVVPPAVKSKDLSKAFNQLFAEEGKKYLKVEDHKHKKSVSPKPKDQRPKSVKIFTKKPLDTNLYKSENTKQRGQQEEIQKSDENYDYSGYPLQSPDDQRPSKVEGGSRKKVKFLDQEKNNSSGKKENNSSGKQENNSLSKSEKVSEYQKQREELYQIIKKSENQQKDEQEEDEEIEELDEEEEQTNSDFKSPKVVTASSVPQSSSEFQSSSQPRSFQQGQDIREYIQEQENYLKRLEEERMRITQQMKQEEFALQSSLKETNKLIARGAIAEENDDQTSSQLDYDQYQHNEQFDPGDQSSSHEDTYKNLYESDNFTASGQSKSKMQSPEPSAPSYQQSPEINQKLITFQEPNNFQESEDFTTQQLMMKFLKPKAQGAMINLDNFIRKSQEKQEEQYASSQKKNQEIMQKFTASPGSELSYSLSEIEKSVEKNHHFKRENDNIKIEDQNEMTEEESVQLSSEKKNFHQNMARPKPVTFTYGDEGSPQQESLGEIFKKRKAELARKLEEQQLQRTESQDQKVTKSKEELLKIRKEMMKRPEKQQPLQNQELEDTIPVPNLNVPDGKGSLMNRLVQGEKARVDKKEMVALTNKNFELLPEVKKKKESEEKKGDLKRRMEKVKQMDQRVRENLKKRNN